MLFICLEFGENEWGKLTGTDIIFVKTNSAAPRALCAGAGAEVS